MLSSDRTGGIFLIFWIDSQKKMKSVSASHQENPSFTAALDTYLENFQVFYICLFQGSKDYYVLCGVTVGNYLAQKFDAATVILVGVVVLLVIYLLISISMTSAKDSLVKDPEELSTKELAINVLIIRITSVVKYTWFIAITQGIVNSMNLTSSLLIIFLFLSMLEALEATTKNKQRELGLRHKKAPY